MKNRLLLIGLVLLLFSLRLFVGLQINFSHEDFNQIFLIGLEHALFEGWSYWGPDVIWSETRLPGAVQALLAGAPISLTNSPVSAIVLVNIITTIALTILAIYISKRFSNYKIYLALPFLLLQPFTFQYGSVMLNLSYIILSGCFLIIAVSELFFYRDNMILNKKYCFMMLGFSLLFTYQLHLTYVTLIPFIIILFFFELKRKEKIKADLFYFFIGCLIGGITVIPTIIKYYDLIFFNTGGNLNFRPDRLSKTLEYFGRFFSFGSYDIDIKFRFYKVAANESTLAKVLLVVLKILSIVQSLSILIGVIFFRKKKLVKKNAVVFLLTFFMVLFMSIIANKHFSNNTYLILFSIPTLLYVLISDLLMKYKIFKFLNYSLVSISFLVYLSVGILNYHGQYSYFLRKDRLENAVKEKDPSLFENRRSYLKGSIYEKK